jgi:hypothetical protein
MQLETALRLPALAMQLSKLVKTLVLRITKVPKRWGPGAPLASWDSRTSPRTHTVCGRNLAASRRAVHAAARVKGVMRRAGAGEGTSSDLTPPNTPVTVARAQRIRRAAVSGCSPYACATCAAQSLAPNARTAAMIAWRTCSAPGSSERCSGETNSASARAAVMLRWYVADCIVASLSAAIRRTALRCAFTLKRGLTPGPDTSCRARRSRRMSLTNHQVRLAARQPRATGSATRTRPGHPRRLRSTSRTLRRTQPDTPADLVLAVTAIRPVSARGRARWSASGPARRSLRPDVVRELGDAIRDRAAIAGLGDAVVA